MEKKKKSGSKKKSKTKSKADYKTRVRLIKTIVVAVAIVIFWRGIWGLMDLYFFPNMLPMSYILSLFFGLIILLAVKHIWESFE